MRRVLFGGTFDPPHVGHVEVAEAAGRLLGADRVSLIPSADPPHKPRGAHASAADRLEMVRRAAAGRPLLDVLDVELRRAGRSYTIDTVEELMRGECRGDSLVLLVGQDQLLDLPKWHRARELVALLPIAVVPRPGARDPDWQALADAFGPEAAEAIRSRVLRTPRLAISSSDVRRRLREGRSADCRVPEAVLRYIEERGLYREGEAPAGAGSPSE